MDFRKLKFIKNATNAFGRFKIGDRAQGRFPKSLIDDYLKHGILEEVDEPIGLDEEVKDYSPVKTKRAAKKAEVKNDD
ncbi:hypothetical protein QP097_07545 [Oligella urethralis]|uniref:hypothetical protein n=1 Tax=Oligella urethralis TaxID=90245 RepID=UPI00242F64A0|nr:hypothetical protein [Oligella urethralis]MDK6203312.1 hypothetical protein [Oligella urethralis]